MLSCVTVVSEQADVVSAARIITMIIIMIIIMIIYIYMIICISVIN